MKQLQIQIPKELPYNVSKVCATQQFIDDDVLNLDRVDLEVKGWSCHKHFYHKIQKGFQDQCSKDFWELFKILLCSQSNQSILVGCMLAIGDIQQNVKENVHENLRPLM